MQVLTASRADIITAYKLAASNDSIWRGKNVHSDVIASVIESTKTKTSVERKGEQTDAQARTVEDTRRGTQSRNQKPSIDITKGTYKYDDEFKAWVLRILNSDDELIQQIPLEMTLKLRRMVEQYARGDIIDVTA